MSETLDFPLSQKRITIATNNEAVRIDPDPKINRITFEFAGAVGEFAAKGTDGVALADVDKRPIVADVPFEVTVAFGTALKATPIYLQVPGGAPVFVYLTGEE